LRGESDKKIEARRRLPAGFFVATGNLLLQSAEGAMRRTRLTPAAFAKEAV
jgi:hypothetical protein